MAERLTFRYEPELDILFISKRPPYPEQETEELGDDVIARINPATREIENLEVLSWSGRLRQGEVFELPVTAVLRSAV
jgi:uncharacterized protein YuzE